MRCENRFEKRREWFCLMVVGGLEEVEEVWRWMLACFVKALV